MTPDEMKRTIDFLIEHSAQFTIHMDQLRLRNEELAAWQKRFARQQEDLALRHEREHELFWRGLTELRQATARFQAWAVEVIAIHSSRLDQHDHRLDNLPPTS